MLFVIFDYFVFLFLFQFELYSKKMKNTLMFNTTAVAYLARHTTVIIELKYAQLFDIKF
jgi:hypothetical protein